MEAERTGRALRLTGETDIDISVDIDGSGNYDLDSGIPFFDHMLSMVAKHGMMDLAVSCKGDLEVDDHHTVEDIGIAFGEAFKEALGDKRGITRYATAFLPMDESLVMVSLDLSGRPFLVYDVPLIEQFTGTFDAQLIEEFMRAFAFAAGITLHVRLIYGKNTHHIVEAAMKALGRTLDSATRKDERIDGVPSTKGVL